MKVGTATNRSLVRGSINQVKYAHNGNPPETYLITI